MFVNQISASGTQQAGSAKKSDELGKDEFLFLLITQLKNQDPLSPMNNTEFTAQMAQFSSLEQLININDNLIGLQTLTNSLNNTQALTLIGREIEAAGNLVHVGDGKASNISFTLPESTSSVNVHIMDSNGQVIRTLFGGYMESGSHEIEWDAMDHRGRVVAPGLYSYAVEAVDASGNAMEADTFMRGVVEAVSIENGITYLHVGDKEVMLSEVTKILRAGGSAGNQE